jgi:hypothetical protein
MRTRDSAAGAPRRSSRAQPDITRHRCWRGEGAPRYRFGPRCPARAGPVLRRAGGLDWRSRALVECCRLEQVTGAAMVIVQHMPAGFTRSRRAPNA